jgi:hypothetical protein
MKNLVTREYADPMFDRDERSARWAAIEAELNRLHGLSRLSRESFGSRIDQLESE